MYTQPPLIFAIESDPTQWLRSKSQGIIKISLGKLSNVSSLNNFNNTNFPAALESLLLWLNWLALV